MWGNALIYVWNSCIKVNGLKNANHWKLLPCKFNMEDGAALFLNADPYELQPAINKFQDMD